MILFATPTRTPRDTELDMNATRRRILDVSIDLVRERGVRAVSFREVARRAGMSHQTPYHHFGNHQGILRAIAEEGFIALRAALQAADEDEAEPIDALCRAGCAYVQLAIDSPGHFRVMFDPTTHADVPKPNEGDLTHRVLQAIAARVVEAGLGRGLDAATLADLCFSTAHGAATLLVEGALRVDDDETPADVAERVVTALSELLRD